MIADITVSRQRCQREFEAAQSAGADTSSEGLRLVWVRLAYMIMRRQSCTADCLRLCTAGFFMSHNTSVPTAQALVHSRSLATDVARGVQLADSMMDKPGADEQCQRELIYLRAVGKYRAGKLLEARRQLDELLKV